VVALSCVRPTTFGTGTSGGPDDTTRFSVPGVGPAAYTERLTDSNASTSSVCDWSQPSEGRRSSLVSVRTTFVRITNTPGTSTGLGQPVLSRASFGVSDVRGLTRDA
jgi:hypothetical protein